MRNRRALVIGVSAALIVSAAIALALFALGAVDPLAAKRGDAAAPLPAGVQLFDPAKGHYKQGRVAACLKRAHRPVRKQRNTLIAKLPQRHGKAKLVLRFYRTWAQAQRAGQISRTTPDGRKAIGNILALGMAITDSVTIRALLGCLQPSALRDSTRPPVLEVDARRIDAAGGSRLPGGAL